MKLLIRTVIGAVFCLSLMGAVKAQDGATYVEEVSVQDSTYMDDLFMDEEGTESKNNTVLYVIIGVVAVAGGVLLARKMKK